MIKANFSAYSTYITDSLNQWDLNQTLTVTGLNLTTVPVVHFSNSNVDRAIVRQATMDNHVVSVGIPNSLLQDPLPIKAHIGIYEGKAFKVVDLVEIPVIPRKRPLDYQIETTDEEVYSFAALENALANKASNARVDNIIAHNNDTDGSTELVDVRYGADGVVYPSAGEAVRGQSASLQGRLDDMTTPSSNLFDKRRAVTGKFLEYTNTGNTYDIEGFFVSNYIPVKPGTTYNMSRVSGAAKMIAQYDANKAHIASTANWTVTTAENAAFIRFSTNLEHMDSTMFVEDALPSTYRPYREKINCEIFPDNALDGATLKNGTAAPAKVKGYRVTSRNLFNPAAIIEGVYLYEADGGLKEFDGYFVSEYITVKPGTIYASSFIEQVAFYDKNAAFIKKLTAVDGSFTTPENAAYIRVSDDVGQLTKLQINEGATLQPYDTFAFTVDGLNTGKYERRYTLGYAWSRWAAGEKFPIGILGDSTTDGASTTGWTSETSHEYQDEQAGGFGTVDYINENAYPYKLEALLRAELGNTILRVYNIGYSGFSFHTIMEHYDAIFSGVYADVKMVGINLGINDRIPVATESEYYTTFRENLVYTVNYLYARGIQPFLITSQATVEPYPDDSLGSFYPLRTSEDINSIANRVKREVAQEYGLELIDMTMYDEFMMLYSGHKITDIISDDLHYKDLGHTLEAEFLFSAMAPRTVEVTDKSRLGFASQRAKSTCPSNKVEYLTAPVGGLKLAVNYTKADASDIVMQDFIINIKEKVPLTLTAHCTAAGSQYVVIDDDVFNITDAKQVIGTLDVGVHRIKAMSGSTATVNWIGFTFSI